MTKRPSKLTYLWLMPLIFVASSFFLWGIMDTFLPRWTLERDIPWCLGFGATVTAGLIVWDLLFPVRELPDEEFL